MRISWPDVLRDYESITAYHHALSDSVYALAEAAAYMPKDLEEEWEVVLGLYLSLLGKTAVAYVKEDDLTVVPK